MSVLTRHIYARYLNAVQKKEKKLLSCIRRTLVPTKELNENKDRDLMRGQVWHCMNGVWHKSPATCAFHSYCSWVIKVVVIVLGDFVWVGESLCLGWSQGDVGRCPGECALAGHEWRELKEKKGRMLKATKRVCKTRVNGQSDCYLVRFSAKL